LLKSALIWFDCPSVRRMEGRTIKEDNVGLFGKIDTDLVRMDPADRRLGMYTIYDKTARESGPIFLAVNDGVALRQYRQLLSKTVDPDEYDLYQVGLFDQYNMLVVGSIRLITIDFDSDAVEEGL